MSSSILPQSSAAFSWSIPSISIILFVIATILVIVSVVLRKNSAAKILNVATIVCSAILILINGIFVVGNITGAVFKSPSAVVEGGSLRAQFRSIARSLDSMGYSDINVKLADLGGSSEEEGIFYYCDGESHIVQVYAAIGNSVQSVYTKQGIQGALFLVENDGKYYLLDYLQDISGDYTQNFSYELFRFDHAYNSITEESDSLSVSAYDEGGGSRGSSFFSKIKDFLANASVCYDPYTLMGYDTMQPESDQNYFNPDSKYLYISNCSTSKTGVVTMKKDTSWLNLRSGPSTSYDPVLMDPSDKDSCVKQTQYSIVTVLEPYNTGDATNPVWYRMRISYKNRTLEGYSAQRYINVGGIKKLSIGERFTVCAESNDSSLRWSSSDSSVASIDAETGAISAKKSGVVLITVTSSSGLSDSCLLMVE